LNERVSKNVCGYLDEYGSSPNMATFQIINLSAGALTDIRNLNFIWQSEDPRTPANGSVHQKGPKPAKTSAFIIPAVFEPG